jgi:hypothetical protein
MRCALSLFALATSTELLDNRFRFHSASFRATGLVRIDEVVELRLIVPILVRALGLASHLTCSLGGSLEGLIAAITCVLAVFF